MPRIRMHGNYDITYDEKDRTWTAIHFLDPEERYVIPQDVAWQITHAVINREMRISRQLQEERETEQDD